ncbi:hypothetical protein ABI59_19285 [Acidobacteria bacterium Mor1]|nr:hypothetical protein ABI59_19285 [Acidobacteria bacterium Mor1]
MFKKPRTRFRYLLPLMLIVASAAADRVSASERTVWKSVAMACTPTSETLERGNFVTTGGRVKHDNGALGTISFICPFNVPGLRPNRLYRLRARVNRLSGNLDPADYTSIKLRGAFDVSGHVIDILETETAVPGSAGDTWTLTSPQELIGWQNGITYWVQITIRRDRVERAAGREQIPSVLNVELLQD